MTARDTRLTLTAAASMTDPATTLATIGTMATAIKSIAEALSGIRGRTKDAAAKRELSSVFDSVLALQARVFDLQQTILRLQDENRDLRAHVRAEEGRSSQREEYERRKIRDSWVIVPKGEEGPYLCPTCFDAGTKSHLSILPRPFRRLGTHRCTKCEAVFDLPS